MSLPEDSIRPAATDGEINAVRALFREYAAWLAVDFCFQGFAAEPAGLPGRYASPQGRLLLAWIEGKAVGYVGLRPLEAAICEMKRLSVRSAFRGHGLGRLLAKRVIGEAKSIGYSRMQLDTLSRMAAATRLYAELGFKPIEPY